MTKKRIALLLAIVMVLNNITLLANTQKRLESNGIDYVEVSHSGGSEETIKAEAKVSFKEVDNTTNNVADGNYADPDDTEFYNIKLTDSLGNSMEQIVEEDALPAANANNKTTIQLENIFTGGSTSSTGLKNGRLYKMVIEPGHQHYDSVANKYINATLDSRTSNPARYFITDLNTEAAEEDGEITISWEYIPNAIYKLTYIDMDCATKDEVDGVGLTNYTGVGSKTVELKASEMDVSNGKVKYVLEDTLPGQRYSAYVIVSGMQANSFLTDSWDNVGVNKETPKIAKATKSIGLDITNIGNNRIQLSWTLRSWMNGQIKQIKIWRRGEGETTKSLIGTINSNSGSASDSGTYEHDEPTKTSYYQVEFIVEDSTTGNTSSIFTEEKEYVPYSLREKPLKPQIPNPYSNSLDQNQITNNKSDYLVKGDDVAVENMKDNTFHVTKISPLNIQLVWDAPTKKDNSGNSVVDYDVSYDIWVSDHALNDSDTTDIEPIISDFKVAESDQNNQIKTQGSAEVIGFKTILEKYTDKLGQEKNLTSNNTYYIKIVAKKAYGSIIEQSQPTVVTITVDKNGDIYAPPILSKPPLQVKEGSVTEESATIEWLEKWYEIKADDPSQYSSKSDTEQFFAKLWNSRVYTDNSGASPIIRFEGGAGLTEHNLITSSELATVKAKDSNFATNYSDREVTLGSDVKYEIKSILYDDVIASINGNTSTTTPDNLRISKWVIENESNSTTGWSDVTPTESSKDGLTWKDYQVSGLAPNTKYLILVRAYRVLEDGTKLMQTYPSYVMVTTETAFEPPEAKPTVPILNAAGVTDTSVSVWWTYNKDFEYEIKYGRVDDVSKAATWSFEISDTLGDANYVADGGKATIKITGLLPETGYYVWLKAKQKVGNEESDWSNSVLQTTSSVDAPDVPRGLGTAQYQTILALGQDFKPVSSDYITVEWLRDENDIEGSTDATRAYSYVVEFADNVRFQDAITFDVTEGGTGTGYEILDKTTIKFTGLDANKKYYVRVKTVLTLTLDDRVITKESEFTSAVGISTKTSGDEYDGGDNPNVIIYPEPIVQTFKDGVWTYEIVDAAKVTTQILSNKQYYYNVPLTYYKNKYDATTRTLKMPLKVLSTIANQGMVLQVETTVATYEIPGQALKNYISQYEGTDIVQFDFSKKMYSDIYSYARAYPEEYKSGEKLDIRFRGDSKSTVVNTLDSAMKVKMKLDVLGSYNYNGYFTYQYNYQTGNWDSYDYQVDTENNKYLTYSTQHTGLNSLYARSIANGSTSSSYLMNTLASKYNITGLGTTYTKNATVKAAQYVKLMVGIAENSKAIDLTAGATALDYQKASAAGFYTSATRGTVTKEQALAGAVKLYEMKHGNKIKASNVSFSNASYAYREALSKAYAVGMIDSMSNPQGSVNYEELCDWIAIAVD